MESNKEQQELMVNLLQEYIRSSNIDKLGPLLNLGFETKLPKDLLIQGHNVCGSYFIDKQDYFQAIPHLNTARSLSPNDIDVCHKSMTALLGFYLQHADEYSLDDLNKFEATLLHFAKQVELYIPDANFLEACNGVLDTVKLRRLVAEDIEESTVTFRVNEIYNSYYNPKTYRDVLENFAFAIEDDLRDFYDIEKKKAEEDGTLKKKKQVKKKDDKPKDQE